MSIGEILEVLEVLTGSFRGRGCAHDDDGAGAQAGRGQGLPEGDRLVTSGAHYVRMSKKDLVEAAVEFYLNAREEMQAGMCELLGQPDGSLPRHSAW
jgi:hypothetical protein